MKIIVVAILSGLSLAFVSHENRRTPEGRPSLFQDTQNEKVKIKKVELPAAARKTLEGDAFKGWTVVEIYKTKGGEFEVELKKGDTIQAIKFDKDGKVK